MANSLNGPMILVVAGWVVYLIALSGSRLAAGSKLLPDHPNHRSSHVRITSKAGGLAIIGAWLAGMFIIGVFYGSPDIARAAAMLSGLTLFALGIGVADDKWALSPALKFAGQLAIAALFTTVFAPLEVAPLPVVGETPLGAAGVLLTILWIAGFMNAFNFMDGVNGIAAGCAAIGLCGFVVVAAFSGAPFAAIAAILLALACFGFIPANFKRGKLFMGDNGSQAISFLIASLCVLAANASDGRASILVIPVIFMPFLFDVSWTLVHRLIRRQNILSAHREHLYQLLIRSGLSHMRVAMIYMTLTAFSTAVAIFMLTLAPGEQWIAPALLAGSFAFGAVHIQKKAASVGVFEKVELKPTPVAEVIGSLHQAAE